MFLLSTKVCPEFLLCSKPHEALRLKWWAKGKSHSPWSSLCGKMHSSEILVTSERNFSSNLLQQGTHFIEPFDLRRMPSLGSALFALLFIFMWREDYVVLDEINFPLILVYNTFWRETIGYRNIARYFNTYLDLSTESAEEVSALFSVSPMDILCMF